MAPHVRLKGIPRLVGRRAWLAFALALLFMGSIVPGGGPAPRASPPAADPASAGLLLVIGNTSYPQDRIDMDRDALASAGWSWDEWDVSTAGNPPLATLQAYEAVLWDVGLEQYPAIPDDTATLLHAYIDNGGRLYINGHDIGWAACAATSYYATPERCTWVRSVLKADYVADPEWVDQQRGVASDPISGTYTAGVPYVGHRMGGMADEVTPLQVAGTTTPVWNTTTGDPVQIDGVKWISNDNNGTATPGCVWCGGPSRVVYFAFEFTGLNYRTGVYNDPVRTDILNRTIAWLLGRDSPTVRVISPNGGEVIATNTLNVTWSRSQPLSAQQIWYSRDDGASWSFVKDVGPTNATHAIDIRDETTWPDGDRYRIRVVVTDTGTPPLSIQDSSDGSFSIRRPGADLPPSPATPRDARLTGAGLSDVTLSWDPSADDGAGEDDVVAYLVYASAAFDPQGAGYALLATLPAGTTILRVAAAGVGDPQNRFYRLVTMDASGRTAASPDQFAKYARPLAAGAHLLSIPVRVSDTRVETVLQTVDYRVARTFVNPAGQGKNWLSRAKDKPWGDLRNVNETQALWLLVNVGSELVVAGLVPASVTVRLAVGWNFVGYPSFVERTVSDALAGANVQTVEGFDPANPPFYLRRLAPGDTLRAGDGLWVHVSEPFDWTLSN